MPTPKKKARAVAAAAGFRKTHAEALQPGQSTKSTATEAQRQRILVALSAGPKTSYDLRRMGCYQAPARIFELRNRGYSIRMERVTLYDRDGFAHKGAARYHLESEPQQPNVNQDTADGPAS